MTNWEDKPVDEYTKEDRKEMWKDVRTEVWTGWKIIFVIQMIIGSHALYSVAAEMPDMSFLYYTFILLSVSAIAATILLIVVSIVLIVVGSIIVSIMMWNENRKEKRNEG